MTEEPRRDEFLRFQPSGIAGLLHTHSLAVPFYQRSFSWRTNATTDSPGAEDKLQVVEYWEDLLGSFQARASYFLGTVVLSRDGENGREHIIDGQQRLATTSLLLAAIRDEYRQKNEARYGDSTQQDYLGRFDRRAGTDLPRLILNTEDRDFYTRRIVDADVSIEPSSYSHRLVLDAYDYLKDRIAAFTAEAGSDWLDRLNGLIAWLDEDVQIVAINVATEADAFLVFETLNDRGADLTVADLLKNYLFSKAGLRLDEVRDSWTKTLAHLNIDKVGNQRFTTFARHLLSSRYGRVRERDVYGKIKGIVRDTGTAVTFSQELQEASRIYYALLASDSDYWSDFSPTAANAADVLADLNLERSRPLLLAVLMTFPKVEMERFLPAIVCWSVRGLIAGTLEGGSAETAFCEAAREVRAGRVASTEGVLAQQGIAGLVPTDVAFKAQFATWRTTRGVAARYMLRTLELQVRGAQEPELVVNPSVDGVNLEHILPKAARRADWPAFNEDDQRLYVDRLGNMCLLQKGPNGRIGNKPWTQKQLILAASQIHLTSECAVAADWGKAEIDARQARLADLAVAAWPREPR